jgi:nucleoside-diphosphate-sugar epimerase
MAAVACAIKWRLACELFAVIDAIRSAPAMSLKVLFIGGTGNISLPCVAEAVAAGHRVSLFNRGATGADLPPGVTSIVSDMSDAAAYRDLGKGGFDVVCQFIAFRPTQMAEDIAAFSGHVGQYIFISSASVYEKPPRREQACPQCSTRAIPSPIG